jgi:hypothetical protein
MAMTDPERAALMRRITRRNILNGPEGPLPEADRMDLHLPAECDCGGLPAYWRDADGITLECDCDFGYIITV